jgi:hypothetical protein
VKSYSKIILHLALPELRSLQEQPSSIALHCAEEQCHEWARKQVARIEQQVVARRQMKKWRQRPEETRRVQLQSQVEPSHRWYVLSAFAAGEQAHVQKRAVVDWPLSVVAEVAAASDHQSHPRRQPSYHAENSSLWNGKASELQEWRKLRGRMQDCSMASAL